LTRRTAIRHQVQPNRSGRVVAPALALALAACGGASAPSQSPADSSTLAQVGAPALTVDEVRRVVAQAAAEASANNLRATIAVTDSEAHVLAVFVMDGANPNTTVESAPLGGGAGLSKGLKGATVPASLAAIAKASTGALLSSGGNAFSTRTASFIVQEHFPPLVDFQPGGPLFGVQFSSMACSDFRPGPALGLSADPGGLALYKNGVVVGGVGVEGDGRYSLDRDPADFDSPVEEIAALGGTRGFEAPPLVLAEQILVDGIRFTYANPAILKGGTAASGTFTTAARGGQPSAFTPVSLNGVSGRTFLPVRAGSQLTAAEVTQILGQGAKQTSLTRAAIRQPLGSNARVSITVVDLDGSPLGFFQNDDAPNFGMDVSAQKARTANFFSSATAGDDLRKAGFAAYLGGGVPLDGSVAYTARAVGFLAQPFYPPGINDTDPGPFSLPISVWSPFNTGLQLDLITRLFSTGGCTDIPRLKNGITIFPGGVPLFKGDRLVGAVGVSGDGIDQDDLIASASSAGFEAPQARRADQLMIRGVRLPYVKFPRHPEL
jgi:uncharacterized protein GlcG (DUF336 family)